MEKEKTLDCLCIRSIDYKDNDKLITLYAFGEGKITAQVKGVKKAKAKLKYSQALLCFGKYYLAGRNGYYNVIGCDLIDNFYGIWTDLDKYYTAMCSLEILDKVADDREIGDKIAVITLDFLNEICYKTENNLFAFANYLNKVLSILGYPLLPKCITCGNELCDKMYYSYVKGGLVCKNCRDSKILDISDNVLKLFMYFSRQITQLNNMPSEEEFLNIIKIYFSELSKNLSKKFKTFEEFVLFYAKINNL